MLPFALGQGVEARREEMDHPCQHLVGVRGVAGALGFDLKFAPMAQDERQRASSQA